MVWIPSPVAILAVSFGLCAIAQEVTPTNCTDTPMPSTWPTLSTLPDPFLMFDGSRVSSKAQWMCRREEIKQVIQTHELGPKPPKPDMEVSFSGGQIRITCSEGGKSVSFAAAVRMPSGAGQGPVPAIIGLGGSLLPNPGGVATIQYNNEDISRTNPRGQGKFYDLYGSNHKAGGLMAWAWGVSRIMDALEELGPDVTGIDPTKVAVTGCSRNGKGAMISGAFDDRIALTIPQEGGSGGPGCWRLAADMKKRGKDIEDANQIITGDGWFSTDFEPYAPRIDTLPHDHHMLGALIAPRGFLIIENSGIDYLGPFSSFGCSKGMEMVFNALGVDDHFGFSQNSHGSSHCQLPGSQRPEVLAFMDKFLLGKDAETDVWKSDGTFDFQESEWIDWEAPSLV